MKGRETMCGIVGYVERAGRPILAGRAERLEYRGYDSLPVSPFSAGAAYR